MLPNLPSDQRQGITKSGPVLVIPSGLSGGQLAPTRMPMGQQSHQREQAQQGRGSAHDRPGGPEPKAPYGLALGFDAQVSTHLVQRDFQLPSENEPLHDLHGLDVQVRAQQGLGLEFAFGVPDQDRKSTRLNSSHHSISY